jgi:hypothetical protein
MNGVVGRFTRPVWVQALVAVIACVASLSAVGAAPASRATQAQRIAAVIRTALRTQRFSAVLVHVSVGGRTVIRKAFGPECRTPAAKG